MICRDAEVWLRRLMRPTLPMNSLQQPAYDLGLVNSARPHREGGVAYLTAVARAATTR